MLIGNATQRLVLQVTALIYNGKLLTTAVMLDNLAEKVEKCPLNQSCYVLGPRKLSVIWNKEVAMKQGFLKY